jgi:hypoxanthine-DNA glycosylase
LALSSAEASRKLEYVPTSKLHSFAPVTRADARVLILGSLPGARSLADQQYYAQPHNAFWRIMGELVGAGREHEYRKRLACLAESGLALWDVVAAARRVGSLDAAIERDSVEINDFAGFFERCPAIQLVCFNGRTAADLYRRRVLPTLPHRWAVIESTTLPSTSPAHAGMPYAAKLAIWRAAIAPYCVR